MKSLRIIHSESGHDGPNISSMHRCMCSESHARSCWRPFQGVVSHRFRPTCQNLWTHIPSYTCHSKTSQFERNVSCTRIADRIRRRSVDRQPKCGFMCPDLICEQVERVCASFQRSHAVGPPVFQHGVAIFSIWIDRRRDHEIDIGKRRSSIRLRREDLRGDAPLDGRRSRRQSQPRPPSPDPIPPHGHRLPH